MTSPLTGCSAGIAFAPAASANVYVYEDTVGSSSYIAWTCLGPSGVTAGYCVWDCGTCTMRIEMSDGLPVELLNLEID